MKKFQKSKYVLDEIDMIYKKKKKCFKSFEFQKFRKISRTFRFESKNSVSIYL